MSKQQSASQKMVKLIVILIAAISAAVSLTACGRGDSDGGAEEYVYDRGELWRGDTEYGITIRLPNSGDKFVVPPMGVAGPPADVQSADDGWVPDWILEIGDSEVRSKSQELRIDDPDSHVGQDPWLDPYWVLAWGAAMECEYVDMADLPHGEHGLSNDVPIEWYIVDYPWQQNTTSEHGDQAWYFLAGRAGLKSPTVGSDSLASFHTCDEVLRAQILVECVAGKLEEVASTLVPITWTGPASDINVRPEGHYTSAIPAELHDTWVIPPQEIRDSFIARDAARNALAHLARLDHVDPLHANFENGELAGTTGAKSCSEAWVQDLGETNPTAAYEVYGHKWFAEGITDTKELARHYLKIRNETLEGAGHLLKRIIDKTVEADLGEAEHRRADQTDNIRGLEAYWGVDGKDEDRTPGTGTGPLAPKFGSVDHALYALTGRVEVGSRVDGVVLDYNESFQPIGGTRFEDGRTSCGTYRADELMAAVGHNFNGQRFEGSPPMSGRWTSREAQTEGERHAVSFLLAHGIVIRDEALTQVNPVGDWQSALDTARAAIVEQVLLNGALQRGVETSGHPWHLDPENPDPDSPLFRDSAVGVSLANSVADISDGDLGFAISHVAAMYRLLTGAAVGQEPYGPEAAGLDLADSSDVSPQLSMIQFEIDGVPTAASVVIRGGVPVGDLTYDVFAMTAAARTNSECENRVFATDHPMDDNVGLRESFQNTFMIGDSMRRRLSATRDRLTELSDDANSDLLRSVSLSVAGLLQWTGPGRVWIERQEELVAVDRDNALGNAWYVNLTGFSPDDFGVPDATGLENRLQVVWGPAWYADCAAGLRSSCRFGPEWYSVCENGDTDPAGADCAVEGDCKYDCSILPASTPEWEVLVPDSVEVDPTRIGPKYGIEKNIISFEFSSLDHFFAEDGYSQYPDEEHMRGQYHLVQLPSPERNGRVLASFQPKEVFLGYGEGRFRGSTVLISDYQRQKLNEIFKIAPPGVDGQTEITENGTNCLGYPRDYFVPLENELTSDSDGFESSWRHYLNLAHSAAAHADELGREIVRVGLDRDIRAEGAGEAIASICGSYGSLDQVSVENGTVPTPGVEDQKLSSCVGEDTVDIVALADAHPALVSGDSGAPGAEVRGSYKLDHHCNEAHELEANICSSTLSYSALGLSEYVDIDGGSVTDTCTEDALEYVKGDFDRGDRVRSHAHASTRRMEALLSGLELKWLFRDDNDNGTKEYHYALSLDGQLLATSLDMGDSDPPMWPNCAPPGEANRHPYCDAMEAIADGLNLDGTHNDFHVLAGAIAEMAERVGRLRGGVFSVPVPVLMAGYPDDALEVASLFTANDTYAAHAVGSDDPYFALTGDEATRQALGFIRPWPLSGAPSNADYWNGIDDVPNWGYVQASNVELTGDGSDELWGQFCDLPSGRPALGKRSGSLFAYMDGFSHEDNDEYIYGDDTRYDLEELFEEDHGGVWYVERTDSCNGGSGLHDFIALGEFPSVSGSAPFSCHFRPTNCPPSNRVPAFVPSGSGFDKAALLSCALNANRSANVGLQPAPGIKGVSDIPRLEGWLKSQEIVFKAMVSQLVISDIPARVVEDIRQNTVPGGDELGGTYGEVILQLEEQIRQFSIHLLNIGGTFAQIGNTVNTAYIGLQDAEIQSEKEAQRLAMERLDQMSRVVEQTARVAKAGAAAIPPGSIVETFTSTGELAGAAIDATAGAAQLVIIQQQMQNLSAIEDLAEDGHANRVSGILGQLQSETTPLFTTLSTATDNLLIAQGRIVGALEQLEGLRNQARYELAKGAGADFVVIDGQPVTFPVNTVNNRLFNIATARYENALKHAKRMAYFAKLAIEQRVGLRLDEMDEGVGALEAPSNWAIDFCNYTGVDYEALSTIDVELDEEGNSLGNSSIDEDTEIPFIGDYVRNLESFVEYYNLEYPSREGDDVAVLSLRDDLMVDGGLCESESPNLLYYSGNLGSGQSLDEESTTVLGWQSNECDDDYCLTTSLVEPCDDAVSECLAPLVPNTDITAPPGVLNSSITWLRDVVRDNPPVEATDYVEPRRLVFQEVDLEASEGYLLSWWDLALDFDGAPTTTVSDYRVAVYDENWDVVAIEIVVPNGSSDPAEATWSERQSVNFLVPESGRYKIAFKLSGPDTAPMSVAIANVQLEVSSGVEPSTYAPVEASRALLSTECTVGNPEAFRSQFEYVCEDDTCFYELSQPLSIYTDAVNEDPSSPLRGKIAAGNYNYRHLNTALNVVGSGVIDCAQASSEACYGTGYIEYTLEHDAYGIPIVPHNGVPLDFNFGSGGIHHGKALAAERYITLPVGSADQSLLQQPQTTKAEFMGRPLSGVYRLRIHDTPSLAWEHVEDIQMVMNYRYWSRVQREQGL